MNKVVGILLAAGRSLRMGADNKLLVDVLGWPLVRYAAKAMTCSSLSKVIIVTGYEAEKVALALDDLPVQLVLNPLFTEGQASSVRAGMTALDQDVTDVLIGLGDMPLISSSLLNSLIKNHIAQLGRGRAITFPTLDGGRGNPVLWDRTFFSELSNLTGDSGGRQLLDVYENFHNPIPIGHHEFFYDVDTKEELTSVINELKSRNHIAD